MKKFAFALALAASLAASAAAWAATPVRSDTTLWETGEYVVDSSVTVADRINVSGDVVLILNDGRKLTANKGIRVVTNNSLTIKTPDGAAGTGKLVAKFSDPGVSGGIQLAGIGGDYQQGCGTITIVSGDITASGGDRGAGIGGGCQAGVGKITILGGTVHATGVGGGAGIGGGWQGSGGTIEIAGGMVTATGGSEAAGIGGGYQSRVGTITIRGGTVHAVGGWRASGIGCGDGGSGGTISILGGSVTASGPSAINADTVTVDGGIVHATGDTNNVGITGGSLTVNGGTINAICSGGSTAVGIGSGTVKINDGTIYASGGLGAGSFGIRSGTVEINGGLVVATGGENGAGIGSGGKLKSGEGSSPWIVASSVKMDKSGFVSGVLFDGKLGEVYGLTTLSHDAAVSVDMTLTVLEGATLKTDKILKVDGALEAIGYIVNDGTIVLKDMAALRALTSEGHVSGSGEIAVIDMSYFHNDGSLVATTEHPADEETIDKYVVKGAGLAVMNGAITKESAIGAITASGIVLNGSADEASTTPLMVANVEPTQGDLAFVIFDNLRGISLVSGDSSVAVGDLNIVKVIDADESARLTLASGDMTDGTYAISHNRMTVSEVSPELGDYSLVVCIADEGKYDLAKGVKGVVDPIVLVKASAESPHDGPTSGGGGSCGVGLGVAALICLAAIKIKRRR